MMHKPPLVSVKDYEDYAAHWLQKMVYDYYRSGADDEHTLAENTRAFKRYLLMPRVLRDVSQRDISTTILGHKIPFPVCVAPTAMQKMAHPEGEVATAKAAAKLGTAYTLSTIATSSVEEIAAGAINGLHFLQVYIYKDRQVTASLVRRAEQAGFKALMLTVDTPTFGKRRADNKNRFKLPDSLKIANFPDPNMKTMGQSGKQSGLNEYAQSLFDPTLSWDDVKWLQSISKLPVVLKGILREDDARKAVEMGVAGILVSNHGARQLDTVPATIDVLPNIVRAVEGRCEVYLDGGIRGGTDILKALALGARAVFVGRPVIYGLAYDGENGVQQVLELLRDEFSRAMALSGCRTVDEINPNLVVHRTALARL